MVHLEHEKEREREKEVEREREKANESSPMEIGRECKLTCFQLFPLLVQFD